jgi:hypothetical protein
MLPNALSTSTERNLWKPNLLWQSWHRRAERMPPWHSRKTWGPRADNVPGATAKLFANQPAGGVVKYESSCDWRFQTPKILPKQEGFQLAEASFRENKNPSNSLSLASLAWIVTTMIHLNVCEWMSRIVSVHEGGVGKCWKRIRWGSVECGGDVPPRDCLHHALTGQCKRPGHVLQDTASYYISTTVT